MNDIPEEDLRTLEERFGDRFVRHAAAEADAEESFASVFPESAEEVESLTRLAARHEIPLMARGAGTALHQGKAPRALVVRFDGMQRIRLPEEAEEDWVEVEPGATWVAQEDRLRDRGMGPRVYPRGRADPPSAAGWPRTGWGSVLTSTVGCLRTSARWRPSWRVALVGRSVPSLARTRWRCSP
jgi:FAD/FMN-containing dehydrogenase